MSAKARTEEGGLVLAFDLGGTRLKAAAVRCSDRSVEGFVATDSAPTADAALARVETVGRELLSSQACKAVGLAVPGLVEDEGRIIALPGKLDGIVGRDLAGWLRERFSLASVVRNDAVAYGVGEAVYGAGCGHERVVVMTVGTGIGVCVLQDGLPITRGALGGGILGGQIPIGDEWTGPTDTNGKRGTIEALCAARRIVDHANAEGGQFEEIAAVYDAYGKRDRSVQAALAGYRRDLARGLAALAHAHTPSAIVLGGGPMVAGNPVMSGLQALVDAHLWPGYRAAITTAELGEHAALLGIAHVAGLDAA